MITNVYYRPKQYTGAYNPIVWSFKSNLVNNLDFNYVVDIYVNSATGATASNYRLKQRPNQQGVCMVDVNSIVQPFINLSLYSAEEGWGKNYRNGEEILANVFIKVGEEFLPSAQSSTKVIQNGLGVTGADPAYIILAGPTGNTKPVSVLPSALDYDDNMTNMSSTSYYGFYSDYILGPTGSNNPTGKRKFLSEFETRGWDSAIKINKNQHHTLTFINRNDLAANEVGSFSAVVQGFVVNEYDANKNFIKTSMIYNNTANGGGPQDANNYTATQDIREDRILTFRCGTKDLNLDPQTAYYKVYATYKQTATTSSAPGLVASEVVYFKIDQNCQDIYPVVRLSWLNELGGRDYYNFNMFYELTSNSPEETYTQTQLNWNSTTPVSINPTDSYLNWQRGGKKSINKYVNKKFKIESDWVTQKEMDFLGAIAESPSVWAYIGEDPTPYTINVTNSEYTYKNIKQTKLTQVSFQCEMTRVQQKQNL